MNVRTRLIGALVASATALALGALAAWPIYRSAWLWIVAAAALLLGAGAGLARERWKPALPLFVAALIALFALSVLPVAVPSMLTTAPLRGLSEGVSAVALGWKQLLTLDLPVGTYQTVLVPAYVVFFTSAVLIVILAARQGRIPVLAAIPMLAPVAFGTVFGASEVSPPLALGPLTVAAPRELGLWLAASALAAAWVAWTAGAERRAALKLGRVPGSRAGRGRATRVLLGSATVVLALLAGILAAPVLDANARDVPRDHADPEIVVRNAPSPLAAYRSAKRDQNLDAPLFSVTSDGALPERLRLAALDEYDGVDFHVGADEASLFTRFPTGTRAQRPAEVTVQVQGDELGVWVPVSELATPPRFSGPRAALLSDSFYLNRGTGTGIIVPRGEESDPGLHAGDGFTARMETAPGPENPAAALGAPRSAAPLVDLEQAPQLAAWLEAQQTTDFAVLLERLRGRGYLSHSLTDEQGERLWLDRLSETHGMKFESSPGGHSLSRIEDLFEQLNSQQSAAGENATEQQLIAGIGDDEQFATAAALIARSLGYEARVVVGVRLAGEEVPGVPLCQSECTGEHLAAWIEARGERGDWVAFDATPQLEQAPQRIEEGEQLPEFSTVPEERDAREVDPPLGLGEQSDGDNDEGDPLAAAWLWPILRVVGLALAALLLILLPLLFLPLVKRGRAKRRRKQPVPELRALSAWEELVDRARDDRVALPAGASRVETALAIGSAPAVWLAEETDRAVFSERGVSQPEVDTMWRAVDADSGERRAGRSLMQRLRSAYSLRSYGLRRARGNSDSSASAEESEAQ